MELLHVVGNRPQFIKLAPVWNALRSFDIEQCVVHSGQHYDDGLSRVFFEELELPEPIYNLRIGSGTHAKMTSAAMIKIEGVLDELKPKGVVVYGDTNTTLAAAVTAVKMGIPIFHVEAGLRTHSASNPEEINRIIVDRVSTLLFAPDKVAEKNLVNEGIDPKRIVLSGDVMYDEYMNCSERCESLLNVTVPDGFVLMTWHRQESTSDFATMNRIVEMISQLSRDVVIPMHPRTKKRLNEFGLYDRICSLDNCQVLNPVGYIEMMCLLKKCSGVITDSGGLSKETSFARKPAVYFVGLDIWPQLVECGAIKIIDIVRENSLKNIVEKIENQFEKEYPKNVSFFGTGNAAKIIAKAIFDIN